MIKILSLYDMNYTCYYSTFSTLEKNTVISILLLYLLSKPLSVN